MTWDINHLRKIAGLNESYQPLTESWEDDDDDEDEDVKRADSEAKRRKIDLPKTGKVDVEKDLHTLAQQRKAKSDKKEAPAEKKEAAPQKKEDSAEKKEEAPAEKKRRGRAPQEGSKSGQLRAWIAANPGKKRSEAWAHAQAMDPPFTKAGFSTIYQSIKSKMRTECFILRHPTVNSFILSENKEMGQYQWISDSDVYLDPLVFATESEAVQLATYLADYKNQLADVERVELDD